MHVMKLGSIYLIKKNVTMKMLLLCLVMYFSISFACETDLDCSLNGACMNGVCDCDAAWKGDQCHELYQLPTSVTGDIKVENVSTWGAGTLQNKVDGKFHLYAAEFVGNCGVTTWLTNSQVVRYTASVPSGPWAREEVVLPVWGHCASTALAPNGTVILWALNGKQTPKSGTDAWGNACEGGASPCGFAKHGCGPDAPPLPNVTNPVDRAARPTHEELMEMKEHNQEQDDSSLSFFVSPDGPAGPWKLVQTEIKGTASGSLYAPWIMPNGTTFWVIQTDCPSQFPKNESGRCGTVLRAETWEGPYEILSDGACSLGEDHSIYVDKRGVHCMTHRFSDVSDPDGKYASANDGGHAFSVDGRDPWYCADGKGGVEVCSYSSPIAYNSTIIYEKDGVNKFGTRERPHMLFDGEIPVALTSSVQHCQDPGIPDACVEGDIHSCNATNLMACKNQWPGYHDRSWTAVTPLRTSKD